MEGTHWTLAQTLQRYGQKVPALVRASGVSKNTVYAIVNGQAKAVTLETVDKLLRGLERLTSQPMTVKDVLDRQTSSTVSVDIDPIMQAQLSRARPFDAEELLALIPDWTDEERAENDHFWAEREAEKQAVREALSRATARQDASHVSKSA